MGDRVRSPWVATDVYNLPRSHEDILGSTRLLVPDPFKSRVPPWSLRWKKIVILWCEGQTLTFCVTEFLSFPSLSTLSDS